MIKKKYVVPDVKLCSIALRRTILQTSPFGPSEKSNDTESYDYESNDLGNLFS